MCWLVTVRRVSSVDDTNCEAQEWFGFDLSLSLFLLFVFVFAYNSSITDKVSRYFA